MEIYYLTGFAGNTDRQTDKQTDIQTESDTLLKKDIGSSKNSCNSDKNGQPLKGLMLHALGSREGLLLIRSEDHKSSKTLQQIIIGVKSLKGPSKKWKPGSIPFS